MSENPKVLLVDDEPRIRECVREMLEFSGYEVVVAATVEEALGLIPKHNFNAALLDYQIEDHPTGGDEVLDAFLACGKKPGNAIFFTATPPSDLRGCGLLVKPVVNEEIIDALRWAVAVS